GSTPLAVNHQGQFSAVTLSFNLAPGGALGHAVAAIERAEREIGLPRSIRASFQGTARAFQAALANQPMLILAALITVYIVLGVLPLALGSGTGAELRRPLGITIVGGLLVSQVLTLYTPPVVYLAFDRMARCAQARAKRALGTHAPAPVAE